MTAIQSTQKAIVFPLIAAILAVALLGLPNLVMADGGYTVKAGDNLTKIARANNTTVDALVAANKAKYPCLATNAACLQAGWVLTLPGGAASGGTTGSAGGTYTVVAGDSLSKIAKKLGVDYNALIAANKQTRPCLTDAQPCPLQIGWVLNLPGGASAPAPTATPKPEASAPNAPVSAPNADPNLLTGRIIVDNQSQYDINLRVWGPAEKSFGAAAGQKSTTELPIGDYGWTAFLNGCQLRPVGNLPVTPFFPVVITVVGDDSGCGARLYWKIGF